MTDNEATGFETYIDRWSLDIDGAPINTQFSRLLPVRYGDQPAMLKLLMHEEERAGSDLMEWWAGDGAARVFQREGDGLLLERLTGERSLATMALAGEDEEATRIICETAALLHAPRPTSPPPSMVSLERWFAPLGAGALQLGGVLMESASYAERLLASQRDVAVLHGDLHHDNVLDGGSRGWLAIDPKGLTGERTFDFVNILRNPRHAFGPDPKRLLRQIDVIGRVANVDRTRLLEWTVAFCGLSAVWILRSDSRSERDLQEAETDLALVETALRLLARET